MRFFRRHWYEVATCSIRRGAAPIFLMRAFAIKVHPPTVAVMRSADGVGHPTVGRNIERVLVRSEPMRAGRQVMRGRVRPPYEPFLVSRSYE